MAYLNTEEISVFPSARRTMSEVSSRLLSEKSLTRLTNMLIDKEGFIITPKDEIIDSSSNLVVTQPLEFNIFGYYFKVNKISDLIDSIGTSAGTDIYVSIELVQSGNYLELYGQDETDEDISYYKGLNISTTIPVPAHGGTIYYLDILRRPNSTGSNWNIVDESYFKFHKDSLDFDIDGGEVS